MRFTSGLSAVLNAEYLHRDVSQNNILLVRRPKSNASQLCDCPCLVEEDQDHNKYELVPVVIDFEYALPAFSDSEAHKVRSVSHPAFLYHSP